jgi:ketosteroid isomerase-like protein
MTLRLLVVGLGLSSSSAVLVGQSSKVDLKADDAAIRAIITAGGDYPRTEDPISWSGAYKRPSVGAKRAEAYSQTNLERRKNQKDTARVQRLDVAASGDMASEFSYGTLEYDLETQHVSFDYATLRVWKKVNGQWKLAAEFRRPLDTPFAPR